jgi:dihydrofolate reductase
MMPSSIGSRRDIGPRLTSIALIAAVARNGVIGGDNRLLWRLKTDLRRFRALTLDRPMVMGRKTYESIGGPLPRRHICVITRDPAFRAAEGVAVAHDIDAGIAAALDIAMRAKPDLADGPVMVAGGGEIYRQTIGRAARLFVTHVDLAPAGDALFPDIDPSIWTQTRREEHPAGPDDEAAFAFVDYARR